MFVCDIFMRYITNLDDNNIIFVKFKEGGSGGLGPSLPEMPAIVVPFVMTTIAYCVFHNYIFGRNVVLLIGGLIISVPIYLGVVLPISIVSGVIFQIGYSICGFTKQIIQLFKD